MSRLQVNIITNVRRLEPRSRSTCSESYNLDPP